METNSASSYSSGATQDNYFYDILQLNRAATESEIKKAYYRLAKQWHPDKNPDDPSAEEQFKKISEAYQILSDANKRSMFDQYGRSAVAQEGGGADPVEGMLQMFSTLFGGDRFEEYFGEVTLVRVMRMQLDPKFRATLPTDEAEQEKFMQEQIARYQEERQAKLIHKLLIKLEPFVCGEIQSWKDNILAADVKEKLEAPGGANLLKLIGYIFVQEAQQHLDRWWGIQSFFAEVREKFHTAGETLGIITSATKLLIAQRRLAQESEGNPEKKMTEQERQQYEEQTIKTGLNTFWRLGKMDIEKTVRAVCETVMRDPTMDSTVKRRRARGLEEIGKYFELMANEALSASELLKRRASAESAAQMASPAASGSHSSHGDIDPDSFLYLSPEGNQVVLSKTRHPSEASKKGKRQLRRARALDISSRTITH